MSAVLVIAGSDSSGGAGLVRDVRTLTELGIDALCAVTAVTAQSDHEVIAVYPLPHEMVRAQIEAALATGRVASRALATIVTGTSGGSARSTRVASAESSHPCSTNTASSSNFISCRRAFR